MACFDCEKHTDFSKYYVIRKFEHGWLMRAQVGTDTRFLTKEQLIQMGYLSKDHNFRPKAEEPDINYPNIIYVPTGRSAPQSSLHFVPSLCEAKVQSSLRCNRFGRSPYEARAKSPFAPQSSLHCGHNSPDYRPMKVIEYDDYDHNEVKTVKYKDDIQIKSIQEEECKVIRLPDIKDESSETQCRQDINFAPQHRSRSPIYHDDLAEQKQTRSDKDWRKRKSFPIPIPVHNHQTMYSNSYPRTRDIGHWSTLGSAPSRSN